MACKRIFLILSMIITLSIEGPCSITTKVEEYTDCRDKRPSDPRNQVCCYLEANDGSFKRCVEVRKLDIEESDDFDKLEDNIKKGTYDLWLFDNYTGFDEYKNKNITINEIDSLRCNNSQFLYFGLLILFLIFYF